MSGPDSALPGGVFVTRRLLNLPWVVSGAAPPCPTGILPDPVLACVASSGFFCPRASSDPALWKPCVNDPVLRSCLSPSPSPFRLESFCGECHGS